MAVPGYQEAMLPLLKWLSDGQVRSLKECVSAVADEFQLSEEDRERPFPSGRPAMWHNRVSWAITHLYKAGLLDRPRRSHVHITRRGIEVLNSNPERVDNSYLRRFPEFVEYETGSHSKEVASSSASSPVRLDIESDEQTPEDRIETSFNEFRQTLAQDLLERVQTVTPAFFERLVVDLLVAMGYGGTIQDAGQVVGRSGDGGIDGVIKEDRLGLDVVYIQAKRWQGSVGSPVVQQFAGSLQMHRARKGVLITTSSYTEEAKRTAERMDVRIVLVDGQQLANLMIEHGVGVSPSSTYVLHRIDNDFFEAGETT